jgi:hypothetical protein
MNCRSEQSSWSSLSRPSTGAAHVLGVNRAIRPRLHMLPFLVTIPPERRDPSLPEELKAEWPAILRWSIDGCREWQQRGLAPPPAVMATHHRTGPATVPMPSMSFVNGMNSWFIIARGSYPGSAITPCTRRRCMPKLPAS